MTLLPCATTSAQDLTLPAVFSDHMVLQRDRLAPVWGWAQPDSRVTVTFQDQSTSAKADATGRWETRLQPLPASLEPAALTIRSGGQTHTIEDVLVGDVWLCSGQSNMQWSVAQSGAAEREIAAADHPQIRQLKAHVNPQTLPQQHLKGGAWERCNPDTVGDWTAVGYYFGRQLQQELDVPIGLLNASLGGTRIEPWIPIQGFELSPQLKFVYHLANLKNPSSDAYRHAIEQYLIELNQWEQTARNTLDRRERVQPPPAFPAKLQPFESHQQPSMLYNGMIAPLVPFAITGSIWYQGEANVHESDSYFLKSKCLIDGWRTVWGQPDLPMYYVQIAPYQYGDKPSEMIADFWLAQAEIEKHIPGTGMVVISDIANLQDIHPTNKQDVGIRLANLALAKTYDQTETVYHSPVFKSMRVQDNKAMLTFDHTGTGLTSRDGEPLEWFEIAGADRTWVPADAQIVSPDVVEVFAPHVSRPIAVRFAYDKLATPNLANSAGLPAATFVAGKQ